MESTNAEKIKNDPLLQPLTINGVTLRNRVLSTSHACGLEIGGMPGEAYQCYHEEKARGGIGLSMFGGSSNVDLDSPNIFRQLNVGTDDIIPYFERFSDRMHTAGAALMCQITHLGRRGDPYAGDRLPTIAPSVVRETLHRSIPKEMDEHDVKRVVGAYAAAARRCQQGGLDGLETIAAGHLIGQFLSPLTNRRTDRFGGSLENRCRFALMVHEAIREAVGNDFPVGIRLVVDEGRDGGMGFEECVAAALRLKEAGTVDFINAIYGSMDTVRALSTQNMPGMGTPIAPWVEVVGAFRREVGLPVFHAARITDLASARYAVSQGKVDMVGMTRAHIADPHLIEKLQGGRESEIRPCVGATHCQTANRPSCLHNVATGRERTLPHITEKTTWPTRNVVVIGAGPAGLEAARITAERGHEVSVYEATPEAGGQMRYGAVNMSRRDLIAIVDWRLSELDRLEVPIHFNSYMECSEIRALNPDIVVLATGGLPNMEEVEGGELCTSTWDVLGGQAALSGDVLVYDGTGRHPAPMVAERASEQGLMVTYISIDAQIGQELTYVERFQCKKRFLELGVDFVSESRLLRVEKKAERLEASFISDITQTVKSVEVDRVVIEQGTLPIDDVYRELRGYASNDGVTELGAWIAGLPQPIGGDGPFELHRIGDAVASRNIHAAMLDAVRLCNAL